MNKSSALLCLWGALTILAGACSDKSKDTTAACKPGSETCQCLSDQSCDAGLTCFAKVCLDLDSGLAGAFSLPGGAGEDAGGDQAGAPGTAGDANGSGGTVGGGGSVAGGGGNITLGGSGGVSHGGTSGGKGGSAGSGGSNQAFPPDPAGCALVSSACPSCCETAGVFALDTLDADATARYVTAFDVTSSAATAEFTFQTSGEVGAIFFHFSSPQDIGALSISGLGTGGTLEIALVRANGKDGCIYPVQAGSLSSTPSTCWGLGAGPYAALPADQIEVRVRSLSAGRAAINVSSVQYAP